MITLAGFITLLGSGWMMFAFLPALLIQSFRRPIAWLLGALLTASAIVFVLKVIAGRTRPCNGLAWCHALAWGAPTDPSLPSGHAAGIFAFATFVAVHDRRWGAVALGLAVLVALSRVALGVHYPTDVLLGAAIGVVVGTTAARRGRRGAPTSLVEP
jgi:undecaprenyl-diphosphatase